MIDFIKMIQVPLEGLFVFLIIFFLIRYFILKYLPFNELEIEEKSIKKIFNWIEKLRFNQATSIEYKSVGLAFSRS